MEIFHRGLVFRYESMLWLHKLRAAHVNWFNGSAHIMLATFSSWWLFCSKILMNHDLNFLQIRHWICQCRLSPMSFHRFHRPLTPKTRENRFLVIPTRHQETAVLGIWWTRQSSLHQNNEHHEAREIFYRVKSVEKPSIDPAYSRDTWEHTLVSSKTPFALLLMTRKLKKFTQDECAHLHIILDVISEIIVNMINWN